MRHSPIEFCIAFGYVVPQHSSTLRWKGTRSDLESKAITSSNSNDETVKAISIWGGYLFPRGRIQDIPP